MHKNILRRKLLAAISCGLFAAIGAGFANAQAAPIVNAGFENGFQGWTETDPDGKSVSISGEAHAGAKSLKISAKGCAVQQAVPILPGQTYTLSAQIKGTAVLGVKADGKIYFERPKPGKAFKRAKVTFQSGAAETAYIFASYGGKTGRFDDFALSAAASDVKPSAALVSKASGGTGLSPDLPPGHNFDLLGWNISIPADENKDGKSDTISENDLAKGYTHDQYFYTAKDGGMVFRATIAGAKTSQNTKNVRSELREMLRRGDTSIKTRGEGGMPNKNNWVLSSAPKRAQKAAGGVDGHLKATLAINHVTTTGHPNQIGRVVIGQIHAKDDEPIRLYYRKTPGNRRGVIYTAHEPKDGRPDSIVEMIGQRHNSAPDPENGFALGEKFTYEIIAKGNSVTTIISQNGAEKARNTFDLTGFGYDAADDFMYFKAGVYNQNHTGDPDDYVQATFYALSASHD